ncbi:MAG: restriction endonuclease [Flavobacteriaceae bacterium]|nr:restriction endonuclease [Flavobacteriaceae bacterium]
MHLPKPFLLLAGISGTGKTRFVREQARYGAYKLVAVRPDWHEPSDLLGYETRLTGHGAPEYVSTEVLKFIAAAWKELVDAGFELEVGEQDEATSLRVSGEQDALSRVRPHWLCLDEMNLAPVEQYFSDYLSVVETRKWYKENGSFIYSCDALLDSGKLNVGGDKLKNELGLEAPQYTELWQLFLEAGLPVPFNLIVAGTVNMDETTHGFSRKVIDRAISFDFGEFFPNDFDAFFDDEETGKKQPVKLSFPLFSHTEGATDAAKESRSFLKAVNEKLKGSPFELAFRALNELLLMVESFNGEVSDRIKLQAVWDDFLMMKLLPRIEGDADKVGDILDSLEDLLSSELSDIWNGDKVRPDLWRKPDGNIACRSKRKIKMMKKKLSGGFTSFWP